MNITVLGTKGEIEASAPYHSKQSGVLINDTVLLDCGDIRFLKYDPGVILISHLHPDHAYFVRETSEPIDIPIYAPESYEDFDITVAQKPFTFDEYHIVPIPTIHSVKVKSTAYLITYKGKTILYTGDMIWIEKKYHKKLTDIDLVITEASFMRKGGLVRRQSESGKIYGHTGVPDLVRFFSKHTDTILFVHFGSWFYRDVKVARKKFKSLARKYGVTIIVGYDGLELTI